MKIAVLITCFNRKQKTLNCIRKLLPQLEKTGYEYKIYVCDDKSTDGTYESLKVLLPKHTIIQSKGDYYWSKGMFTVMQMAVNDCNDYYLMVNDDVDFFEDALEIMFSAYKIAGGNCGIVGSTRSKADGKLTYGGRAEQNDRNPITPNGELQSCMYANWNCFLVDKNVVNKIGLIDEKYRHGFGDYDYSLRMNRKKIPNYIAEREIGYCERNAEKGSFRDATISRKERFKELLGPKGIPIRSFFRYHVKNEGIKRIPACIYGYGNYIVAILLKRGI